MNKIKKDVYKTVTKGEVDLRLLFITEIIKPHNLFRNEMRWRNVTLH